jgi:bacterioferritin-associated ferredoxin
MEITTKDILDHPTACACLCDCIAEKLVEKLANVEFEKYDDFGEYFGIGEEALKCIKEKAEELAKEIVLKETKDVLENKYFIERIIRDQVKEYIGKTLDNLAKV